MQEKTLRQKWAGAAALVMISAIAGCGGEGSGSPVASAPGPVAGPAPVPSPAPAPTPSPTPARDPKFANASIGDTVVGPASCGFAPVSRDSSGAVTGIGEIRETFNEITYEIAYLGTDRYRIQSNDYLGFTMTFGPENRQSFPSPAYVRYAHPVPAELLLSQFDLLFVMLGSYADAGHCFFAAGLPTTTLPGGDLRYSGVVDGIAQIDGRVWRVFDPSTHGTRMDFDFARASGTLSFRLLRRAEPFGDFQASSAVDLGTVTATVALEPGQTTFTAPLAGAGYVGTVRGRFVDNGTSKLGKGVGGAGVALVYDLRSPTGDMVYGAVAYAADLI